MYLPIWRDLDQLFFTHLPQVQPFVPSALRVPQAPSSRKRTDARQLSLGGPFIESRQKVYAGQKQTIRLVRRGRLQDIRGAPAIRGGTGIQCTLSSQLLVLVDQAGRNTATGIDKPLQIL